MVEVLTTHENKSEIDERKQLETELGGLKVRSIKVAGGRGLSPVRKIIDALYFGIWVFIGLLRHRPTLAMVATTPPVIMGAIVRWASKLGGFEYIYHCQDIHPEAMKLNGNLSQGWVYRWLSFLDKNNVNQALHVIVLSNDMKKTLLKRGCRIDHVKIINNFVFEKPEEPKSTSLKNNSVVHFLFAGTMGRFQNLDLLIDAIMRYKDRTDVEFYFMGDGVCRKALESRIRSNDIHNVFFLGQKSVHEAISAMANADFGIVSLAPNISEVAYPSKTMMYLSNGLPLFSIVDKGTELFDFINENGLGIAVTPDSIDEVENAIERAINLHKEKFFVKADVAKIAELHFGKKVVLDKFAEVFRECKS
ncbi:Glycosyltransferase involved in cell wall bisynthesis [Mariprofundus ferrinatatus]|uniref:Glycosyltransferase involved in cell wall bisynthesis n=2 Tax=Mariprofundus ferrinatatus TaxID=1921087 RepID=A0A2K8LAN6_9PROT|nr:Glycosyltransferase involved in cell wall bisynthesis [Mariprofundus ferrinatatus]